MTSVGWTATGRRRHRRPRHSPSASRSTCHPGQLPRSPVCIRRPEIATKETAPSLTTTSGTSPRISVWPSRVRSRDAEPKTVSAVGISEPFTGMWIFIQRSPRTKQSPGLLSMLGVDWEMTVRVSLFQTFCKPLENPTKLPRLWPLPVAWIHRSHWPAPRSVNGCRQMDDSRKQSRFSNGAAAG